MPEAERMWGYVQLVSEVNQHSLQCFPATQPGMRQRDSENDLC